MSCAIPVVIVRRAHDCLHTVTQQQSTACMRTDSVSCRLSDSLLALFYMQPTIGQVTGTALVHTLTHTCFLGCVAEPGSDDVA